MVDHLDGDSSVALLLRWGWALWLLSLFWAKGAHTGEAGGGTNSVAAATRPFMNVTWVWCYGLGWWYWCWGRLCGVVVRGWE